MNDEQPLQLSADELLADSGIEALPEELRTVCRHGLAISGKQLRPNLVLEAARCGPHPEAPEVRRAAIAMELVHVATLTHDDVNVVEGMDEDGARLVGQLAFQLLRQPGRNQRRDGVDEPGAC